MLRMREARTLFVTECPEVTDGKNNYENKVDTKYQPRMEHKHRSRGHHSSMYKHKHKDGRRVKKSRGYHKNKTRAMVAGVRDVDSSTCYTSLSLSSNDDDHEHGKDRRHVSKNFNGLSFIACGFCGMAHSSSSKRSEKDDSDSGSEDEVTDDLDSLCKENAELNTLLDNRDSVLRDAKKQRKELRAVIEDANDRVTELESMRTRSV